MKNITYKSKKNISKDQVIHLYENAGWISYTNDPDKLMQAIENSLKVISAWDQDKLVGLVRVVGDGLSILYVQDILILTDYKRMGIGSELMNAVMTEFKDVRQKVLLTEDAEETRKFYEALGFKSCDDGITVAFAMQN